MFEWILAPLMTALGVLLGFFYTRTVKMADKLPEKYKTKDDCRSHRLECRRSMEIDRAELLERMDNIDKKLDRLIEHLYFAGSGKQR